MHRNKATTAAIATTLRRPERSATQGQHTSEHASYTMVATGFSRPLARSTRQTRFAHEVRLLWLRTIFVAGPHEHFRMGIERVGSGAPDAVDNTCAQLRSSDQRRHHEPQLTPQSLHNHRPPRNATPTQSSRPAPPPTTRNMLNLPECHRDMFQHPHAARHAPRRVRELMSRNKGGCKNLEEGQHTHNSVVHPF